MKTESINRSRVFREHYLPGAYTKLRNQSYAKVVGVRSSSVAMEGVDIEQLTEAVATYIASWETAGGAVDDAYKQAVQRRQIEMQSPAEVYVSPAPLLLTCRKCKVLDFYDSIADAQTLRAVERRIRRARGREYVSCKRAGCDGMMVQVPYLAVHRCGISKPLFIHFSARRATSPNIGLNDAGSFLQSSFFDVETGQLLAKTLQDNCEFCKKTSGKQTELNNRGTPITNGESFYAQCTQYISLSEQRGKLIAQAMHHVNESAGVLSGVTGDIAEGTCSALLRRVSSVELERQLTTIFNAGVVDPSSLEKVQRAISEKQKAKDTLKAMPDPGGVFATAIESMEKDIEELKTKVSGSAGRFRAIRELVPSDAALYRIVKQRRTLEAVLLQHDVSGLTVESCIDQTSDLVQRESLRQQWERVKDNYSVAAVTHIPDLRVVLATVGFSRERATPSNNPDAPAVVLNRFEDSIDESMRGRVPVYAMSAKTEALWIRLDPRKVLAWCVRSAEWSAPDAAILASSERSHAYLLENCRALTMSPGEAASRAVLPQREGAPLHLLHTISHSLLLTARRHSGYDDKSIMEYLLPMDLSVLLYVSSVQNYTSGGLLSLFKHHLLAWFDDASMYAFNCAFDPVCSDVGGACSGCIQTEIGCETFNHGPSRSYVHGGAIDRERSVLISGGFWDASGH